MNDPLTLMPFRTVADRFHLIDSETKTVYIPRGDGAPLVEDFRSGLRSKKLLRSLGRYGVNIYPDHFSALDQAGVLELLEDGSAILTDLSLYSEEMGLTLEVKGGQAVIL